MYGTGTEFALEGEAVEEAIGAELEVKEETAVEAPAGDDMVGIDSPGLSVEVMTTTVVRVTTSSPAPAEGVDAGGGDDAAGTDDAAGGE